MKKIQRFLRGTALLAVLSLLVSATAFAASVPDPTSDFYVNDYVGVLSGDTKSDIVSKNDGLYNATGAQIVVTVVQDTGGVSMEQYAYDMANAWGIGSAEKNNGVLLLLSVGDDDYQCIQGSGLETLLPTSTLSRILQEDLEPDFADKNYDAGVKKTFASLYDAVSSIYGYDGSTGGAANPSPVPQPDYDYGYGYAEDPLGFLGQIVFLSKDLFSSVASTCFQSCDQFVCCCTVGCSNSECIQPFLAGFFNCFVFAICYNSFNFCFKAITDSSLCKKHTITKLSVIFEQ